MDRSRTGRLSMPAQFFALVLVLHAFLSAWSAAAMPADPVLDGFGNPLCISGFEAGGNSHGDGHSGLPDCCALGCPHGKVPLAPPPGPGAPGPAAIATALPARPDVAGLPGTLRHGAAYPRAPPLRG